MIKILTSFYLLLLILLFINNNGLVDGFLLKDVSKVGTVYKLYSSKTSVCSFNVIDILCVQAAGEDCSSLTLTKTINTIAISREEIAENGTAVVYQYSFITQLGQGSISLGNPSNLLMVSINLECLEPDLNKVSLSLYGNKYLYPSYSMYSVIGEYQVNGLSSDASIGSLAFTLFNIDTDAGCGVSSPTNHKLLKKITILCLQLPTIETTPILQIQSTTSKNFTLSTIKREFSNVALNSLVTLYPKYEDLPSFIIAGYNQGPIFSFTFNTSLNDCYFKFLQDGVRIQNDEYFPIYSNDSSTTVLVSLANNDVQHNYLLYSKDEQVISNFAATVYQYITHDIVTPSSMPNGNLLTFTYAESINYYFNPIEININSKVFSKTRFPFGYVSGGSIGYTYEVTTLIKDQYNPPVATLTLGTPIPSDTDTYDNSKAIKVLKAEKFYLDYGMNTLLRITIKTPYGFNYFLNQREERIGSESRISGDQYEGVYEIRNFEGFQIYDQTLTSLTFTAGESTIMYINDNNQVVRNFEEPVLANLNLFSIKQVSFLYNNIDVSNHRVFNSFYFNFTSEVSRDTLFKMTPLPTSYNTNYLKTFVSKWNDSIKLFQIDFYVDGNDVPGIYQFFLSSKDQILYNSNILGAQLNIKSSNFDGYGPIIKQLNKVAMEYIDNSINSLNQIGWVVTIEDLINGFDWGYFVVYGEIDHSTYNITIRSSDVKSGGNIYLGEYDIKFYIALNCVLQYYTISQVKLFDRMGRMSYFSILPEDVNFYYPNTMNPFINYLQDNTIYKYLTSSCPGTATDVTTPELLSFEVFPTTSIDVSKSSRLINFKFIAADTESGMKPDQYPIVYISDSNNKILECKSNYSQISASSSLYQCQIDLPLGFGFPGNIIFSVYGFINNHFLFKGYPTNMLSLDFSYTLTTTFDTFEPVLTSYTLENEKSTELWLYGRGFNPSSTTTTLNIINSDGSKQFLRVTTIYSTVLLIKGIKPSSKPFRAFLTQISLDTNKTVNSNELLITPSAIYDFYTYECNNGIPNPNSAATLGCICNNKWTTLDTYNPCSTPNHYISSTTQVSAITGGKIVLYGWFGQVNNNPVLYIDNKLILSSSMVITSDSITTTIGPGNIGAIKVNYTQNSIVYSGTIYPYFITEKECPSNCSQIINGKSNGNCDKATGQCICNSGFSGLDCSILLNNNNNNNNNNQNQGQSETQVGNNGTTVIKNQDGFGFSISIDSIVEIDINDNIVSTFNLTNNWKYLNKTDSVTRFTQTRFNQDNTEALIGLIIEEVNDQDKEFTFAGNEFTVSKGGFKLSLTISNWYYQSNLNILQIQMSSDIQLNQSNNDKCNNDGDTLIESSSNNNYLLNNINYLKVSKNNRVLYARFQDKMLVDNRPSTVIAKLLPQSNSNSSGIIKVGINLPVGLDLIIDPDFSLLITSDYKFECEKSDRKWVVAVAVVVSVAGVFGVLISLYFIYKKSTFLKIKYYSFKKRLSNK